MPDPSQFLRNCQRDRGTPDIHDIPMILTPSTLDRYIVTGGKRRAHMREMQTRHAAQYDNWLKESPEHSIISLSALRASSARYAAAEADWRRVRQIIDAEQRERDERAGTRVTDLSEPSWGDLTNE